MKKIYEKPCVSIVCFDAENAIMDIMSTSSNPLTLEGFLAEDDGINILNY